MPYNKTIWYGMSDLHTVEIIIIIKCTFYTCHELVWRALKNNGNF